MSPPASYARVLAALKRISPPWPSTATDKAVGKELGSIATAIGTATDPLDGALEEIFPDTTTQLLDRWEGITSVATRTGDTLAARRARVLSVLRRAAGVRIDQLELMLLGLLAMTADDFIWIEITRDMIEEGLTQTTGAISVNISAAKTFILGKPWPSVVDGYGVQVYLSLSGTSVTTATLKSPDGTVWNIPVSGTGWYQTSSAFEKKPAGGTWTLTVSDTGGAPLLLGWKLMVSNEDDSAQIYNFFVYRDPDLPGTPDLVEAQRLFHRSALGHMRTLVIETMAFTVGDSNSLVGRDPVGV